MAEFLKQKALGVKRSTLQSYTFHNKKLLKALPPGATVHDLNAPFVQSFINRTMERSSFSTVRILFSYIRQLLTFARRRGYIEDMSWLSDIELKAPPLTPDALKKKQDKLLDKEELHEVLEKIRAICPPLSLIFEFQALTGLRFGEIVALRIEDYNGDSVSVNGTYTMNGERTTPKNVYSVRTVQLNSRSKAIINDFIEKAMAQYAVKPPKDERYILINSAGSPYALTFANTMLHRIDYPKKVTSHTFRHTHISMLAEQGLPLKAIMDRVGHSEPRTTLAVYTHVTKEMGNQMASVLEKL